jgi:hypothetical protein
MNVFVTVALADHSEREAPPEVPRGDPPFKFANRRPLSTLVVLVLRQRLGSSKLLEAGAGVKTAEALIQVVQHFEMDTLKHGSDLGFATPDEHGCHPHSEIKSDIVLLKRFLTLQPIKPTQQQLDVLG